ncbi:MAG: hypothetical protein ACR2PO_17675 [Methyloligellaceae bacterium]
MNDQPSESGGEAHPPWMASLLGDTLPPAPYPGLRPFEAEEEVVFFGRDQHVNAILSRLASANFVAVVGPSGCGKSSLVKAGVIPALEAGRYYEAGTDWAVTQMRPGTSPLWNLARALLMHFESEDEPEPARIADASSVLAGSDKPLTTLLRELGVSPDRNILILVDQFEELFRYEAQSIDAEEGIDFVSLLLSIQRGEEENVSCVITMRTDHLGDCTRFDGLPEAINETLFLTPRLNEAERRAAIEGPVRLFGDQIKPDLTDALIHDMEGVDDQLPLMQHVLLRLWRQASNGGEKRGVALELEAYNALGGLKDALDRHAGEVMGAIEQTIGADGARFTEGLFRQLTERRDDSAGQDVRRPLRFGPLAEACGIEAADAKRTLEAVVETFVRPDVGFLRLEGHVAGLHDETLIDIVHECLIRKWSNLQRWVEREWEAAKKLRDLVASTELREGTRTYLNPDDTTYYAKWRDETQPNPNWASRYDVLPETLTDALQFLDASIVRVETQKQRERDELEREARSRESTKRKKFLAGAVVLFTFVLIGTVFQVQRQAKRQYEINVNKFYKQQKKLSELINAPSRANAESMLELLKKTSSQPSIVEGIIANPKLRFAQLEELRARKVALRVESEKTMDSTMRVSKEIELERDARKLIADHKLDLDKLDASFDAHMSQLHTEIQRDIGNIPRARGVSLQGNYSAVALRPDGRQFALAGGRQVERDGATRYELVISLRPVHGVGNGPNLPQRQITPETLREASVLEITFSPDGRYLAASVTVLSGDGQEQVYILVWDVRSAKQVDQVAIPWQVTDYGGLDVAISGDSRNVAMATAGGSFLVCAIGRCAETTDPRSYRTGRVKVTNQTEAISETLSFLSLVPGGGGGFFSLHASQESFIWAYRLALDMPATRGARPIAEPTHKLPWMPQFQPKPRSEGKGLHYCEDQDTLIAIDQRATGLLAWKLSGTGQPACDMRFVSTAIGGPVEIWRSPRNKRRWLPADQSALGAGRLFKGWEDRAYVVKLDSFKDLSSAFRFPFRIVSYEMDRAGSSLITLALPQPASGGQEAPGQPPPETGPIVSVWRSLAGHHVAFLGERGVVDAAAIGLDGPLRRVLLAGEDGAVRQVRWSKRDTGGSGAGYRFDGGRKQFVPASGSGVALPARNFSETLEVTLDSAAAKGRVTVSLSSDDGLVKSFQPKHLWRHKSSQIAFGVVSSDGRLAALSIPGGGGEETEEPALEIWDTRTGKLQARVLHKSRVLGATFLGDGRYVATLTAKHGAWLSIWKPDDLKAELCGRLNAYDLVGLSAAGVKDVCAGN